MSTLAKRVLIGVSALLILGGLCIALIRSNQSASSPAKPTTSKQGKKSVSELTTTGLKRHPQLTYSAIIYYAIKEPKLQRWQEVNDFKAGWQVEHYASKHPTRYLVWPDQHMTTADKNLAPNWFSLQGNRVTYDSMIVHSFRKDQTATTTLPKIVARINAKHAAQKVRRMPTKMTVLNHK